MDAIVLRQFGKIITYTMQVSVVIPMAVTWWRWQQLPSVVRLLSLYTYVSLACSMLSWLLHWMLMQGYIGNNYLGNFLFNTAAVALFMAVYYRSLSEPWRKRLVLGLGVAMLLLSLSLELGPDRRLAMSVAQTSGCAVLLAFALLYMDAFSAQRRQQPAAQDPIYLLSIGLLIKSAGAIVTFSLQYFIMDAAQMDIVWMPVPFIGLLFNYYLTLAFLRARRPGPADKAGPAAGATRAGRPFTHHPDLQSTLYNRPAG